MDEIGKVLLGAAIGFLAAVISGSGESRERHQSPI